jgi:hypothetical protein
MLTPWPNGLGFDCTEQPDVEIWKHCSKFRVFTADKCLLVPYTVTTNPETALSICKEQGLSRSALDDMDPRDAQVLFSQTLPDQVELF